MHYCPLMGKLCLCTVHVPGNPPADQPGHVCNQHQIGSLPNEQTAHAQQTLTDMADFVLYGFPLDAFSATRRTDR